MPFAMEQPINTATGVIVETNNFHQVIQHFNDAGELTNMNTRFSIDCQICMCKNLALTNTLVDVPTNELHEKYAVLPRCGHAFGFQCLGQWIKTQKTQHNFNLKCPSCRSPIACEKRHSAPLKLYGPTRGSTSDCMEKQRKDIAAIRATLLDPSCTRCLEEQQEENARRAEVGRPVRNNQTPQHIDDLQRTVQAVVREGNSMERRNNEEWESLESLISDMHTMVRQRNQVRGPSAEFVDLSFARDDIEEAILRQRNGTRRGDEDNWEQIESGLSDMQVTAEERIERQRRAAEFSQTIRTQISVLQRLLQEGMYL
ncbi:hypothetical protein F5Y10DRAFT_285701 [Nemania abortiva]|nr:hypothetical protein F5Y10DRAFT_285701 [Nemania abortiva]